MTQLIGLAAIAALVFGALLSTGGSAVVGALPLEFALISGAAVAALLIANAPSVACEALGGFWRAIRGPAWRRRQATELLALFDQLFRRARQGGLVAIERDFEAPSTSQVFADAPAVLNDAALRDLICDAFRTSSTAFADPSAAIQTMDQRIEEYRAAREKAAGALYAMADALPALGIVAAVIGIIRAMGAIDGEPEVIGAAIASALLGTLLGVFLAYGIVGPVAQRFEDVVQRDSRRLDAARSALTAFLSGATPSDSVEAGRRSMPSTVRPEPSERPEDAMSHRIRRVA